MTKKNYKLKLLITCLILSFSRLHNITAATSQNLSYTDTEQEKNTINTTKNDESIQINAELENTLQSTKTINDYANELIEMLCENDGHDNSSNEELILLKFNAIIDCFEKNLNKNNKFPINDDIDIKKLIETIKSQISTKNLFTNSKTTASINFDLNILKYYCNQINNFINKIEKEKNIIRNDNKEINIINEIGKKNKDKIYQEYINDLIAYNQKLDKIDNIINLIRMTYTQIHNALKQNNAFDFFTEQLDIDNTQKFSSIAKMSSIKCLMELNKQLKNSLNAALEYNKIVSNKNYNFNFNENNNLFLVNMKNNLEEIMQLLPKNVNEITQTTKQPKTMQYILKKCYNCIFLLRATKNFYILKIKKSIKNNLKITDQDTKSDLLSLASKTIKKIIHASLRNILLILEYRYITINNLNLCICLFAKPIHTDLIEKIKNILKSISKQIEDLFDMINENNANNFNFINVKFQEILNKINTYTENLETWLTFIEDGDYTEFIENIKNIYAIWVNNSQQFLNFKMSPPTRYLRFTAKGKKISEKTLKELKNYEKSEIEDALINIKEFLELNNFNTNIEHYENKTLTEFIKIIQPYIENKVNKYFEKSQIIYNQAYELYKNETLNALNVFLNYIKLCNSSKK